LSACKIHKASGVSAKYLFVITLHNNNPSFFGESSLIIVEINYLETTEIFREWEITRTTPKINYFKTPYFPTNPLTQNPSLNSSKTTISKPWHINVFFIPLKVQQQSRQTELSRNPRFQIVYISTPK